MFIRFLLCTAAFALLIPSSPIMAKDKISKVFKAFNEKIHPSISYPLLIDKENKYQHQL